jgi:Protein of unknown function (DUF2851)
MLSERLLQFIWQFQYFNNKNLFTAKGEPLQINYPGVLNTNQGPDFLQAKIKIFNTLWAGNIELHILASDWQAHHHGEDEMYNNIILHVVWINDKIIKDRQGNELTTLEMQPLVSKLMMEHYNQLMQSNQFVSCEKQLPVLTDIAWDSWKERLLVERLQKRSAKIFEHLFKSNNHWEEVLWWLLARNFGIMVNADAFEGMAQSIPINILAKHKNQIHQLEALLLGQANLLNGDFEEEYAKMLQREYIFLLKKYTLKPAGITPVFLRMRPSNFPTIRLAQLAALIATSTHLFSKIKEATSFNEIIAMLNVTANDYWHYHYRLGDPADYKPKMLGRQMAENIMINTIIPVLFAYGAYIKDQQFKDKSLDWLMQLAPEANNITKQWKAHGIANDNALHSQGLLELKKSYCDLKRCLDCAVGNKILKGSAI